MKKDKILLAIDPATSVIGYAVIKHNPDKQEVLDWGLIKLNKKKVLRDRLIDLVKPLVELVNKYDPDEVVLEEPNNWINKAANNKQWRVAGFIEGVVVYLKIDFFSYSVMAIKQKVAGRCRPMKEDKNGVNRVDLSAINKEFVHKRVCEIFPELEGKPIATYDQSDAVSIGLCHLVYEGYTIKNL